MGDNGFDPGVLADNLRCKIIYYSCINPNTISDLNKAWGYGSPTYLYQNDSLETLKDADLIMVETDGGKNIIRSNYESLFEPANVAQTKAHINQEILREFLVHSKGFHPKQEHQDDEQDLLGIARGNLDEELEENLQALEFSDSDMETLMRLWRNEVFRSAFLSLDITAGLFGHRKGDLPDNPLIYLFRLTAGIVAAMGRGQGETGMEIPPGLIYRSEPIIVTAYRWLDGNADTDSEEYTAFISHMKDTYSLFRTKFQEDRFHYGFIQDFISLTMQDAGEKKFGKLFKKYRGDSGLF